jgi:hypothetical protein
MRPFGRADSARRAARWNRAPSQRRGERQLWGHRTSRRVTAEAQDGWPVDANAIIRLRGAVTNFLARTHLARGDVRGAITVLDQVGPEHPDEYAAARLWEGIALSALGMDELATRTWSRLTEDTGGKVGKSGLAAVKSAEFLAGALAEKDYRTVVAPVEDFENDMHFVLGCRAHRGPRRRPRALPRGDRKLAWPRVPVSPRPGGIGRFGHRRKVTSPHQDDGGAGDPARVPGASSFPAASESERAWWFFSSRCRPNPTRPVVRVTRRHPAAEPGLTRKTLSHNHLRCGRILARRLHWMSARPGGRDEA